MAHALRDRSAERIRQQAVREGRELVFARNRFIAALNERLRHERKVIRFVYREHPEIAKRATSAYYRASSEEEATPEPSAMEPASRTVDATARGDTRAA